MSKPDTPDAERGYAQLFICRVPKENRDALQTILRAIVEKLEEHGTLRSEFYRLHSNEVFQGFAPISGAFGSVPEEELWVELDHYEDRGHRDRVMVDLGQDGSAGALFRELGPLVSGGYRIAMGEFERMVP